MHFKYFTLYIVQVLGLNILVTDFFTTQKVRGASSAIFCLQNIVMTFLTVKKPCKRRERRGFCRLFTAYDLEIFSALSSGSFNFIAKDLVMVGSSED
jgi:hypothetical protein